MWIFVTIFAEGTMKPDRSNGEHTPLEGWEEASASLL